MWGLLRLPSGGGTARRERGGSGYQHDFIVARLVRTAEQANVAQSILAMVLGIAGGAFFPVQASGFVAALMDLNPVGAFIRGLGISAGGGGPADVAVPLAVMLGFAAMCALASRLIPDRGARI